MNTNFGAAPRASAKPDPNIRTLRPDEVNIAVDWAAKEGWNPGLHDTDAFLAQDKEGFLGYFHEGQLIVTLSAVRYEGGFGFLGFYICRPDMRGRWRSYKLVKAALNRLDGCTLGLDGVVAQQGHYDSLFGFKLVHRNIRYGGPLAPGAISGGGAAEAGIVPIGADLFDRISAYDQGAFLYPRPNFLKAWLNPPEGRALALLTDGVVKGYGVIRKCVEGYKVGPLFADTPDGARALFLALAPEAGGAPVFLDTPEPNGAARALAEEMGLRPVFETARMYRGTAPDLPLARIFGITSYELG